MVTGGCACHGPTFPQPPRLGFVSVSGLGAQCFLQIPLLNISFFDPNCQCFICKSPLVREELKAKSLLQIWGKTEIKAMPNTTVITQSCKATNKIPLLL